MAMDQSTEEVIYQEFTVGDLFFGVKAINEADAEHQVINFLGIVLS